MVLIGVDFKLLERAGRRGLEVGEDVFKILSRMSDSSDQLSSPNSECNSQMGSVHRGSATNTGVAVSVGTSYNGSSAMTGLPLHHHPHPHPQTLTPNANGSPQYPQELSSCGSNSINGTSGIVLNNNTNNFTPEQISCMCEALSQSQDIDRLTRFVSQPNTSIFEILFPKLIKPSRNFVSAQKLDQFSVHRVLDPSLRHFFLNSLVNFVYSLSG